MTTREVPVLTWTLEEECEIRRKLTACQAERQGYLNRLIEMHMDRALAVAAKWARGNAGLLEDLEDEAVGALVDAAETYDPTREVLFWTYAFWTVRGRIRMYFRRSARVEAVGLLEDATVVDIADELAAADSHSEARKWAVAMLMEVDFLSEPAVGALLMVVSKRDAAKQLGMNYDVFLRRLSRVKHTNAAEAFRQAMELGRETR